MTDVLRIKSYTKHHSTTKNANSTTLSKHVNQNIPKRTWKIRKTAPAYNNSNNSKQCNLCLENNRALMSFPEQETLK